MWLKIIVRPCFHPGGSSTSDRAGTDNQNLITSRELVSFLWKYIWPKVCIYNDSVEFIIIASCVIAFLNKYTVYCRIIGK